MQQKASALDGFNQVTIDWFDPDFRLDLSGLEAYDAKPDQVAAFQRDGAVRIEGAFADWVGPLRAGLERNLAKPEAFAFPAESTAEGKPGRYFDSYCNWQRIPEYSRYVQRSAAAAMAGQFMGATQARFFHEHVFLKEPGTQTATPWHQDLPYYCVDGRKNASIFVALDPIDEAVALRFVKGSHRWSRLTFPKVFLDGSDFNTEDGSLGAMPDIDGHPEDFEVIAWAMAPGDALIFDFRTVHGTSAAEVKTRRRAFVSRWLGEDMTYCARPGETSPPYRDHGMPHGGPLRADWFPVLWQAP